MFKQVLVISLVAAGLSLSGCAGKSKKKTNTGAASGSSSGLSGYGAADGGVNGTGLDGGADGMAGAGGMGGVGGAGVDLASKRVIYFEYDSSSITAEGQTIVAAWGKYLAANPSARVRLEGNADERGTREYNVGLGENRGNAVQSALAAAGASGSQISVVSYGEERPAVPGHDESAYAQNRRVEIVQQ